MGLFDLGQPKDRYGVVIDIGSGSVLATVVHSNSSEPHPRIIWSHRELAPLRNIDSLEQSAREVMTALVNVSMRLDAEGRKALFAYNPKAKMTELQCGISAPWSYTVTKTINYRQDDDFTITDDLVQELISSIQNNIESELKENETLQDLGLTVVARSTMDILANGYRIDHPHGNQAKELKISHGNAIAQQYLIDAIDEMQEKLFMETKGIKISFILMLFHVTRELLPRMYDLCLVDITYEATEIGIVRDGVISYSTHTPYGSYSLTREIANITGAPLHEAFGYLHTEKPYAFMEHLPKEQKKEIEGIFEAYTKRVAALFHETGDQLSIPRNIALHADLRSETLFQDLIEKAGKQSLKTSPNISLLSKKIIEHTYQAGTGGVQVTPMDTALLVSAQFFHTRQHKQAIEYL